MTTIAHEDNYEGEFGQEALVEQSLLPAAVRRAQHRNAPVRLLLRWWITGDGTVWCGDTAPWTVVQLCDVISATSLVEVARALEGIRRG
jgi:hypothetical protein